MNAVCSTVICTEVLVCFFFSYTEFFFLVFLLLFCNALKHREICVVVRLLQFSHSSNVDASVLIYTVFFFKQLFLYIWLHIATNPFIKIHSILKWRLNVCVISFSFSLSGSVGRAKCVIDRRNDKFSFNEISIQIQKVVQKIENQMFQRIIYWNFMVKTAMNQTHDDTNGPENCTDKNICKRDHFTSQIVFMFCMSYTDNSNKIKFSNKQKQANFISFIYCLNIQSIPSTNTFSQKSHCSIYFI